MSTNLTVLLIEDDANDALLVQRAFRVNELEHTVQTVANGEQAMAYLIGEGEFANREEFAFPNFIITDLKMPRMGGLELLQWIKDNPEYTGIPIIVLSSSAQDDDVKQAFCLGANAYFVKPVGSAELTELISVVMRYWTLSRRRVAGPC